MKKRFLRKKQLRIFANLITPLNWNIYIDYKDIKNKKGILNICLDFRDKGYEKHISDDPDTKIMGVAELGITFFKGIAYSTIVIQHPDRTVDVWREVIVHELAHVAIFRWLGFKQKSYRKEIEMVLPEKRYSHSSDEFEQALSNLEGRSWMYTGYDALENRLFFKGGFTDKFSKAILENKQPST